MSDEAADALLIIGIGTGTALIMAALAWAPGFEDRCHEAGGRTKRIASGLLNDVRVCVSAEGRLIEVEH